MQNVNDLVAGVKGFGQGIGSTFQEGYDTLVNFIVRPPRASYNVADLGAKRFMFAGKIYHREDFEVKSLRAGRPLLKCSHYKPEPKKGEYPLRRPCVVFLHGNAGSRLQGLTCLRTVLSSSADFFTFDCAGSGQSEGEYVSLGYYEKDDLAAIVDRLRRTGTVSSIGLWGQSMGAVTAMMYAAVDSKLSAIVVDSPFTDLRTLAAELCEKETYGAVQPWLTSAALSVIKVSIQKRCGFDLDELRPIAQASSTKIPAIFATGEQDDFILPYHAERCQEEYGGQSRLITFEGGHNDPRPHEFLQEVRKFLMRTLHNPPPSVEIWKFDAERTSVIRASPAPVPAPQGEQHKRVSVEQRAPRETSGAATSVAAPSIFMPEDDIGPLPIPEPDIPTPTNKSAITMSSSSSPTRQKRTNSRPNGANGSSSSSSPPRNGFGGATDKGAIREQLLALGFTASQVDAAMMRNSTLEGCVEWILTST